MNSSTRKWIVLLALLLLTLILVWKAPEPETSTKVVKPVPRSTAGQTVKTTVTTSVSERDEGFFAPRVLQQSTVDLFATPTQQISVPRTVVEPQPVVKRAPTVRIPFNYIGMIDKKEGLTLFLMSGSALHLVRKGDVVDDNFKLVKIDLKNQQLEWLYLPQNQLHKMSMK